MNSIGSDKDEYERTINDVNSWNEKITNGHIYKKAAHTALHSTIYRTVSYRLPATQFSPSQCSDITFRLHRKILSKMGINQRLANPYRYAPSNIHGLGFLDVRLEQYISHMLEFILHMGRPTLNGLMLQAEIELCQLHVGTEHNLWTIPFHHYSQLLPHWEIKYMLQEQEHFTLGSRGNYTRPKPQRYLDFFLMDRLIHSAFTKDEIEHFYVPTVASRKWNAI